MLKLYLSMAAIALILILITVNIEFTDDDNENKNSNNDNNYNDDSKVNLNTLHNNISNLEYKSAENIALERYIINNEPSNQEILNQQYNKYYWAN